MCGRGHLGRAPSLRSLGGEVPSPRITGAPRGVGALGEGFGEDPGRPQPKAHCFVVIRNLGQGRDLQRVRVGR